MKHLLEFESYLNNETSLNEEKTYQYPGDNLYTYRVNNGKWEGKKKDSQKWLDLAKFPSTITKLNKKFPDALAKVNLEPAQVKPLKYSLGQNVQRDTFEPYKAAADAQKINIEAIQKKFATVKKKPEQSFWDYIQNLTVRKLVPNIVQLFNAKKLGTEDFTEPQKKTILDAIKKSMVRNPKQVTAGAVNYDDYGKEVANTFKNERGSPTMWDVAWNTIKLDQNFAMATLLGQFSWKKLPNGKYLIQDKYDFKDPKYKEISGVNRKSLEGLSVLQLEDKYGLNPYEAARVKGWVDHPDTIPSKSLDVKVEIDPNTLA
jgi:hypothetical protein